MLDSPLPWVAPLHARQLSGGITQIVIYKVFKCLDTWLPSHSQVLAAALLIVRQGSYQH
jgi:hypothetical protein